MRSGLCHHAVEPATIAYSFMRSTFALRNLSEIVYYEARGIGHGSPLAVVRFWWAAALAQADLGKSALDRCR